MIRYLRSRLFAAAFSLSVISLAAGSANAQSPAQLRPQFRPSLPPTFAPPPAPLMPQSRGPAAYPFIAPAPGGFENGAIGGVVNRQGQSVIIYGGPGYGGGQISTPTNIGGGPK